MSEFDDAPYSATQLFDDTWLIREGGATAYLLAADTEALLVDTGDGYSNLRRFAEDLCGKPVRKVANTHGHIDHTGGNGLFEQIYISRLAQDIMWEYFDNAGIESQWRKFTVTDIAQGSIIPIGNDRQLEVFEMGVHSPGSVMFLDRKRQLLFTGDDVMGRAAMLIWRCPDPQGSLIRYVKGLARVLPHYGEFTQLACGHAQVLEPAEKLFEFMQVACGALGGAYEDRVERRGGGKGAFPGPESKKEAWGPNIHLSFDERYLWDETEYTQVKGS